MMIFHFAKRLSDFTGDFTKLMDFSMNEYWELYGIVVKGKLDEITGEKSRVFFVTVSGYLQFLMGETKLTTGAPQFAGL